VANSARPNAVITKLVETLESIDARQARSMSEIRDAAAIYNGAEPMLLEAPSRRERQLALEIERLEDELKEKDTRIQDMVEQVKNPGVTEARDNLIHYMIDSNKLLDKGE